MILTDWAWAAGLFDGEGCLTNTRKHPQFSITQNDRRVLDRFHQLASVGNVVGPYVKSKSNPRCHWFRANKIAEIQKLLTLMWPWLGEAKREQALRVYDKLPTRQFHPRQLV